MIIIAYILVLSLIIPAVYGYLAEKKFLSRIEEREKILKVPVLTIGRKLTAFTIEKSYLVQGSVVVTMNFLRRYKLFWLRLIYGATTSTKWLIDLATREALLRAKESAKDATYLINFKFEFARTNKSEIEVLAYGTAIHLYQDTLGIYFLPDVPIKQEPYTRGSALLKNFCISLAFLLALCAGIFSFEQYYSKEILENFSDEDEKVVWQYLSSSSSISQRNLKPYLAETEAVLQNVLDVVPKPDSLKKYQFKVLLIDSEEKDILISPEGNILFYKGALRQIKSENELFFVFAHAIQHYKNREHIKAMGTYIITPYIFMKAFGDDSFFAMWIVRLYPFYNISFSSSQEDEANFEAVKLLNEHYGHVGGIENNSSFAEEHLGSKSAQDYAKENNFEFKAATFLDIELDAPQIVVDPVNVIPQAQKNPDYKKIIDEFRVYSSSLIGKYRQSMNFMYIVLDPKSTNSQESVDQQLKYIDFGFANIEYYKNLIDSTIKEYDHSLAEVIELVEDPDLKRVLSSLWKQEADNISKIAVFYFDRDYEILKTQQGALNFLSHRIGKFSNSGGRITFALKNDQESYDGLLSRIQEQFAKTPPVTTNQGTK